MDLPILKHFKTSGAPLWDPLEAASGEDTALNQMAHLR